MNEPKKSEFRHIEDFWGNPKVDNDFLLSEMEISSLAEFPAPTADGHISRSELSKWCHEMMRVQTTTTGVLLIRTFLDKVLTTPAAKVRPLVEAHWVVQEIKGNRRGTVRRLCSNCGANNLNRKSNYCPNCGATMGGQDGKTDR